MDAETLGRLGSLDIHWQVGETEGKFDPADLLDRAKQILAGHPGRRVVHGDLHAGNALMPDPQIPDLIDFAMAGSGHPCFDLVRISSAIAYGFMRQVEGEAEFCSFFSRLHVGGASEAELASEFPRLLESIGSRLALHALVACRDRALEITEGQPDQARQQYLAMVYLVAAQSLTIESFQEGVVRAALGAVGPTL
jgi:Ser/Thr protein kinase RdoA (MazF antagonist)